MAAATPKVSVVIPARNRVGLLLETLASVRAQTYANWEAVVVDDRSEDDTVAQVEALSRGEPRIRILRRDGENGGAPVCRNQGFAASTGRYITFLDSDDLLAPWCLENRVCHMELEPKPGFLAFRCQVFRRVPGDVELLWNDFTAEDDLDRFLRLDPPWQTASTIWRRSTLEEMGPRPWDESLLSLQDWDLHVCALIRGFPYRKVSLPIDCYWRTFEGGHRSLSSGNMKGAHLESHGRALTKIVRLLREQNALTARRQRLLTGLHLFIAAHWLLDRRPEGAWEVWRRCMEEGLVPRWKHALGVLYLKAFDPAHPHGGLRRRLERVMPRTMLLERLARGFLKTPAPPGPEAADERAAETTGGEEPSLAVGEEPAEVGAAEDEGQKSGPGVLDAVRLIAFYLPQYHPTPENDAWWGKGFTEWTNVAKAQPLFPGHYQPHLPADLGFYDLRLPEAREAQADLARQYGIYGFCYYHYWFNGRRVLNRPFDEVLASGKPDFPFCLCWANENWTRAWDGLDQEILLQQRYSEEDDRRHMRWLVRAFDDPRYIRIDGKPVFLVYRFSRLLHPRRTATVWREEAARAGMKDVYLIWVEAIGEQPIDRRPWDFDAAVEFQPDWRKLLGFPTDRVFRRWRQRHARHALRDLRVYEYPEVVQTMLNKPLATYRRYPGVTPSWDNSARRKEGATILQGSDPQVYGEWLGQMIRRVRVQPPEHRLVFINAWNEWAEGSHLEPDQHWGRGYLEATLQAYRQATQLDGERMGQATAGASP
jgi:hypothetical protein